MKNLKIDIWFRLSVTLFSATIFRCNADVFASVAEMERLLEAEDSVAAEIRSYIKQEQKRLDNIEKLVQRYRIENSKLAMNISKRIANPVNAFKLIRQLKTDFEEIEDLMMENSAEESLNQISERRGNLGVRFPIDDDVAGAAAGLIRLQDTYHLQVSDLASGLINGTLPAQPMTAEDCFEVGLAAFNEEDHHHSIPWLEESLKRLSRTAASKEEDNGPDSVPDPDLEESILEHLAFSMYEQGNLEHAYMLSRRLIDIAPENTRAVENLKIFETEMLQKGVTQLEEQKLPKINYGSRQPRWPKFEMLCRGELPYRLWSNPTYFCYYKRGPQVFLKLGPIKVETVHRKPDVLIFREVLSNNEIKQLIEQTQKQVQDRKTGDSVLSKDRVSKSGWLYDDKNELALRITKRTELMTNLNPRSMETIQVANYGVGGHYMPHFDWAGKEEKNAFKGYSWGNRIATVIFYLSEPEVGGSTVFPELDLELKPSLNDAAFWYNLHPNGEGDTKTLHAACPVLAGQKWVSNKWIHELNQEFRVPCRDRELYFELDIN